MKSRKTALAFILTAVLAVTAYAQQYDPESEFQVSTQSDGKSVMITVYLGDKTDIRIPPRIKNLPVIGFSKDAFPQDITSLVIPNSVTSIEDQAFRDYNRLTSVTFQSEFYLSSSIFPGNLHTKYRDGGIGTYITTKPMDNDSVWRKQ